MDAYLIATQPRTRWPSMSSTALRRSTWPIITVRRKTSRASSASSGAPTRRCSASPSGCPSPARSRRPMCARPSIAPVLDCAPTASMYCSFTRGPSPIHAGSMRCGIWKPNATPAVLAQSASRTWTPRTCGWPWPAVFALRAIRSVDRCSTPASPPSSPRTRWRTALVSSATARCWADFSVNAGSARPNPTGTR